MSFAIPEILHEAANIFLTELEGHVVYFRNLLDSLQEESPGSFGPTEARLLAEKFHLIKGASGFLKLEYLKETAADSEKYFRDKWTAATDFVEVRLQLQKAARIVEQHKNDLASHLKR